ncbi:hypothetical protein ACIBHY_53850 [Nonomuraea sp. NPDC050547]|uniref:hypothetical protein n=1 Tax=Nonomuraea sp. NPDC050547 TaxID=3364368 RepID=UPI00379FC325
MDTSSATPAPEDTPRSDRAAAEELYQFAETTYRGLGYDHMSGAELAALTPAERLADAQFTLLQAIYHELRHGHDQMTAQTGALTAHAAALTDHADAMHSASTRMLGHADSLDRFRG